MRLKYIFITISFIILANNLKAQVCGCTDPLAKNFNPAAIVNDGSCIYDSTSIVPIKSVQLSKIIRETSGLIYWNNQLWTHNDDTDINLYAFKLDDENNLKAYELTGTVNIDWEEISQDSFYVYIGDFGNNNGGNRTNLKILKILKNSILAQNPKIDTIDFSYSNQTDFNSVGNNTDFDCEAFIVSKDSIYLFTKQWKSQKTSVYSLPKTSGKYVAKYKETYDIKGLITGATYLEDKKLVVLCGYTTLLQPFIYLLYDFNNKDFFSGNKRKIDISLTAHQTEGITTINGLIYYISNEQFKKSIFNVPQTLHTIDLTQYLDNYIKKISVIEQSENEDVFISNVIHDKSIYINAKDEFIGDRYNILDYQGKIILTDIIRAPQTLLNIEKLNTGIYFIKIENKTKTKTIKFIKK